MTRTSCFLRRVDDPRVGDMGELIGGRLGPIAVLARPVSIWPSIRARGCRVSISTNVAGCRRTVCFRLPFPVALRPRDLMPILSIRDKANCGRERRLDSIIGEQRTELEL